MAPSRKTSHPRTNLRNRQELRLKVRQSAPVLLSDHDDISTVTTPKSLMVEAAEFSKYSSFKVGRSSIYNLENMPAENLLRIFSFFTPLQLVRSLGPTCLRFLQLSRDPELWRRLTLDRSLEPSWSPGQIHQSPPSFNVAARLVGMAASHLRSLEIAERSDASSLVEQIAAVGRSKPSKLRSLVLRRIPGPFPSKVLLRALRKFSGIRRLVLRDVRRLRSRVVFRQLGSSLPQLSCLDVTHCPQFGTTALATVATSGLALRELKAFRESGYRSTMPHATDRDFSLFCASMKDSITVIKINAESLTDESCKMLVKCIHLTTLHLRDARGFTAHGILRIITRLAKLVSLDLSGAILLSSGNWAEIFVNMVAAPRIEVLKLAGCFGIDDYSAEHMIFPALRYLSLGGCFLIGEAGYCSIITRCTNLCHLDLEGTGPGFNRCLHLLPVYTPQLELLVFPSDNCPINHLAALQLKMKNLKILDRNEPKRVEYWRSVAVEDELRRLNQDPV